MKSAPRFVVSSIAWLLWAVAFTSGARAEMTVTDLRCDWAVDPLGIDSAPPRLAWKLQSTDRGAQQTAWQIRVASTSDKLLAGSADLWDSGRINGSAQLQIPYVGRRLRTAEQAFWQVRVWDGDGNVSAWSAPATWTMGVMRPEDWSAQWITDADLVQKTRQWLGFSTPPTDNENEAHWVVLDLGRDQPVEKIVLHAVVHTVAERLGFPRWFKLEVATHPDFSDAKVVVDRTAEPLNEWLTRFALAVPVTTARYVRLSVPRLRMMEEEGATGLRGRLALSQIEVYAAGHNVAVGAKVGASASLDDSPWSSQALVDGMELPGANPRAASTLLLRREFTVGANLTRATLFVCGLGHYTMAVNGAAVGENLLTPGWTDYERTCLYDTHDLTSRLRAGANVLGFTLASGMYNVPSIPGRYTKFVGPPRPLKVIAQLRLEYADGRVETVSTDKEWKVAPGPITFSHVYGGEDYDARLEPTGWDRTGFDASQWTSATTTAGPGGKLRGTSQAAPPLCTHETLKPVAMRALRPGVDVYDLGQNTALIPRLRVRGAAGSSVKIIPSELVSPNGAIDRSSLNAGRDESAWNYTLAGAPDGETWTPRFFYQGGRYLQVERTAPDGVALPEIQSLEGFVFHTSSPAAGHFACSNALLNRIEQLVRWAQRSNLVSIMTDCPHRERLGWLEQYHLNGPSLRYEFDLTQLFAKTFGDMADAQRPNGLIPCIAPEYVRFNGYFRDSPEWGSALILAAWQQFVWSGDDTPLRRHYEAMQRYFDYLSSRAEGHILSHGLGDWYDVGPKPPGVSQLTPVPLVATAIYYEDAVVLRQIATQLGRTTDAQRYASLADSIAHAFNTRFLDTGTAMYAAGSQTAQALPLVIGLAPGGQRDAVFSRLVEAVRAAHNSTTAGDVGYRYLLRALADGGRSDVIFEMTNQSERPGYGYQLAQGATSLTEAWNADRHSSQNHFMLGQIVEWFYHDIAGIAPDPATPGFGRVIIRPNPVGDLSWAEATYESVRGPIAVRWNRDEAHFHLSVTIPPNARASVQLPVRSGGNVSESGKSVRDRQDVRLLGEVDGRPAFEIGSGHYEFEVQ